MTASSMPYCDSPGVVSATFAMSLLAEGQREERSAFPEMIVDGSYEMSCSRRSGLISTHVKLATAV